MGGWVQDPPTGPTGPTGYARTDSPFRRLNRSGFFGGSLLSPVIPTLFRWATGGADNTGQLDGHPSPLEETLMGTTPCTLPPQLEQAVVHTIALLDALERALARPRPYSPNDANQYALLHEVRLPRAGREGRRRPRADPGRQ